VVPKLQKSKLKNAAFTQVIIAALNEQQGIGHTITELLNSIDSLHVIVVDGKSTDRTVEIAKSLDAQIVIQNGTGKGDAIATAIKHLDPKTKYVVFTDADFTYSSSELPKMLEVLQTNPEVGMVCGNRFTSQLEEDALHRVFFFGNQLIKISHVILNRVSMKDPLTGLRVIRAEFLKNYKLKSKGFDVEVELNNLVLKRGYEIREIDIQYRERLGEKKLKLKHGLEIFKRIIKEI